jgi:membrane protein YqaA with SNARE-associated domain
MLLSSLWPLPTPEEFRLQLMDLQTTSLSPVTMLSLDFVAVTVADFNDDVVAVVMAVADFDADVVAVVVTADLGTFLGVFLAFWGRFGRFLPFFPRDEFFSRVVLFTFFTQVLLLLLFSLVP